MGRRERPGGAALPGRHLAARHGRPVGVDPLHPHRASPSTPAPRTSGPCRRSAGRPTASPPSRGGSAAPSPASPPCWWPAHRPLGLTFTMVVTVAGLAAALLGGFHSFPLTFVGGSSSASARRWPPATAATSSAGSTRTRSPASTGPPGSSSSSSCWSCGRGLPLRSHVADRLPRLGTGEVNVPALLIGSVVLLGLLFGVIRRVVGAGHLHLAGRRRHGPVDRRAHRLRRPALARPVGARGHRGADRRAVRQGRPPRRAGHPRRHRAHHPHRRLVFALPALRTRGVNLAVVTLGLGFTVSEVVFANNQYLGGRSTAAPGSGG